MSKTVFAEEALKKYVQDLVPTSGFVAGLILGQSCGQRSFIIHLPAFQILTQQSKNESNDSELSDVQIFKSLLDLTIKNLVLVIKQVTAVLPGGLCVLGIYSASKGDGGVLDPSQSTKLQTLMTSAFTKLSENNFVFRNATPEKLVVHFNTTSNKVIAKLVNVSDSKWYLSNTEWRFQSQPIKWQEIESQFAFDFKIPLQAINGVSTLKSNLECLLKEQDDAMRNTHCFLQGEVRDSGLTLDSIQLDDAGDDDFDDTSIQAELDVLCTGPVDTGVEHVKCGGDLVMSGHVYSRIYMQPKSTVADTITALKDDIIRSLYTRFELHSDALIEEEEGSPEEKVVQHDLPRRVLVPLPFSQVKVSHYLFPGETSSDSLSSLRQLLGVEVDESNVEEGMEEEADPELMLPILPSEEIDLSSPASPAPSQQSSAFFYMGLACVALLVALVASLFFVSDNDKDEN